MMRCAAMRSRRSRPLAIQYADYSQWQLECLRVRGTEAETAYWSRQLAGVKPFKVIAAHPRTAMPTTNGAIVSRVLPRDLTNRAQALCADRGATLFAAALGALCATLARFTNNTEIVLGTQVSDRDQVELEPMVGQFVNSLHLAQSARWRSAIQRNRGSRAGHDGAGPGASAHPHRAPPRHGQSRAQSRQQSADIGELHISKTFIQNTAYSEFKLIGHAVADGRRDLRLNFFMVERTDGWRFSCQYNTDQFDGCNRLKGSSTMSAPCWKAQLPILSGACRN